MKLVIAALAFFSVTSFAGAGIPAELAIRNTASVNLHVSYSGPGATLLQNLKGVSTGLIYNGTSTAIAASVRSNTCGATTEDQLMIPANTGLVVENVAMAKAVCIRSLSGSSVTSGTIYATAW